MEKKDKINVKEKLNGDTLDLSLSQLQKVPVTQICSLRNITTLDLSNNNLVVLQENFGNLQHLKSIDLSCNQLAKLPKTIGNLTKLIYLNLYNNSLEDLPASFGDLKKLRYLDLKQNPIQKLPEFNQIIGPCFTSRDCAHAARNTVNYFSQMQEISERIKRLEEKVLPSVDNAVTEAPKKKKSKKRGKKKTVPNEKPINTKEDFEDVLTVVKSPPKPKHNNTPKKSSSAFVAVSLFFLLLTFNMFLFYLATIKYPDKFEKFLEYIEIESFRLKVTDFVQNFITSPDLFN